MRIGETAEQYLDRRGDDDEVWIKGFKDGMTTIRIPPEPKTVKWTTYREHYDEGMGYFPCCEAKDCVGCTDTNPKVRDRSRRYAINALDSEGRVQVYKIGSRLYRTLQGREQRLGTLSDRDYIIVRTGQKLETNYDVDPGEKYDIDWPEPDELHDIMAVLGAKYESTAALYNGGAENQSEPEPEAEEPKANPRMRKAAPVAEPESEPDKPAPRTNPRAKKTAATAEPEPVEEDEGEPNEAEKPPPRRRMAGAAKSPAQGSSVTEVTPQPETSRDEAPTGDDVNGWGPNPSDEIIEAADTATIKAWLDDYEAEYPARAPRSRIVAAAKKLAAEPPF